MRLGLISAGVFSGLTLTLAALPSFAGPAPLVALRERALKELAASAEATSVYGGIGAAWKGIDLSIKFTDAALDREAQTQGAQLVTLNTYAEQLKKLSDEGVDPDRDATAKALRAQVRALGQEMSADGLDQYEFMARAVQRNYGYAIASVTLGEFASWGLEEGGAKILGWLERIPAIESMVSNFEHSAPRWVDGRKWIKGQRQYGVWDALALGKWTTLKARAELARKLPDEYLAKMMSQAADAYYEAKISEAKARVLDEVYEKLKASEPRSSWSGNVRLAVARAPIAAAAAPPIAVAAPPLAIAAAPAPVAARIEPAIVPADPVMRTIMVEDTRGARWSPREAPASEGVRQAPVEKAPDPREEERAAYWHHEWECAGAGRKAGCGNESWDGNGKGLNQ